MEENKGNERVKALTCSDENLTQVRLGESYYCGATKCIFANCFGFAVSVSLSGGADGDVVKLFKHSDETEDYKSGKQGGVN